jgi:hypothetical protein
MNIDYSELERGFTEEMQKEGFWNAADTGDGSGLWNKVKGAWNATTTFPRMAYNTLEGGIRAAPVVAKGVYSAAQTAADAPKNVFNAAQGAYDIYKSIPEAMDNIGKFAPLAIGAMMLPSLMGKGQGQQGGAGQPIVVNNYMGQKPNILTPQQGVNSLSSYKSASLSEKKADVITKALTDAAKRRMANHVLDVVSPEEAEVQAQQSPEELEIVTKYPEMAKLLEDEENKAYLGRLLQH